MKGRINIKAISKLPNVKVFAVGGLSIATDGEFVALESKKVSLLGSVADFRENYPMTARSIGVYLPYLEI